MYRHLDHGPLAAPALVVAFNGWVSAGGAGIATAEHLAAGGEAIVRFDSDHLYDYRVNRPTLEFTEGVIDHIEWPETMISRRTLPERDLLFLTGPEPNWHWQAFAEAVADLAVELGVVQHVSLGGIPWAAPHTRPTIVVTTSSQRDLEDANLPVGTLRVPASATSVVERAVSERGIPTVGFWARVPHYVAGVYHPAVLTLVERVSRHLGIEPTLGTLAADAAEQRKQLDAALDDQPNVREIVTHLESLYDASGEVASGAEIAAEIERYLRDRAGGDEA